MALLPVRHLGLKALSVAVATLMWLVVSGDPIVERTMRVAVELQRTPVGVELVGDVPDTVAVRVRGPAGKLAALAAGDLAVVLDLDGVREGQRVFTLSPAQVTTPNGISVVQVVPPVLPLGFEATASKMVPVRAVISGTPSAGHSVTNVVAMPSQVRIEGPASVVARVTDMPTVPVSVDQATSLVRKATALDLPAPEIRVGGSMTVVVTVTVAVDGEPRLDPPPSKR